MEERAVTIQKIAEVLNRSKSEVEELCENRKIPFHITDEGTAWEAKRFYVKEVLKAVKPEKEEDEKEPVAEEPEKEEAENEEPVNEEAEKAKAAKAKAAKAKAEKEEAAKKAKARTEDPL